LRVAPLPPRGRVPSTRDGLFIALLEWMNTPITFREMPPSPAIQEFVTELANELQAAVRAITSCRVTIGMTNKSHTKGDRFDVHIELHVPHATLIAERTSGDTDDLYAMLNAAFDDLRFRVLNHFERTRERRHEV
jgi:ribosome-associated translation inhibitor RaiA